MAAPRSLRHPPVTEAIFDFRVKASPTASVERLRAAHERIRAEFPRVEDRRTVQYEVRFAQPAGAPELRDLGVQGFFYRSADGLDVAQFRLDGFTYNRLAPYSSWDALVPRVLGLWSEYCQAVEPAQLIRLGVRYLNRVPLPSEMPDMAEFLAAMPGIPAELPQRVVGFVSRVVVADDERGLVAQVSQSLETDPVTKAVALMADIDAFDPAQRSCDSEEIPEVLAGLRQLKNRVFFGLLTDKTLEGLI